MPPTGAGGPPATPPPERSRGWLLAGLLVLLLVVLGVLLFFIGRSLGWWDSTKHVTIPTNIVGQPSAAARSELQQKGFTHISIQPQASSQYRTGLVVGSRPPPGSSQATSTPIVLLVSSGPAPVAIPSVVGQTQAAATAALQKDGFVVNVTNATSSTVPSGNVITTNPLPGTKQTPGSAVQLVVSTGKPVVTIPSLTGQTPSAAGQVLGAHGLTVASQIDEPSATVPFGEVTRTSPTAGTSVPVGSSVTVYVSTGPQQVSVPNLGQDTKAEAQTALKAVGLVGNFTTQPVTDPTQDGLVISQNPAANATLAKGSTVNVVLGSFTSTSTSTSTPTTSSPTTTPSTTSTT